MSGHNSGWSFTKGAPGNNEHLTGWAKAGTDAKVVTSSGATVDFYSRNFDTKHLKIVADSTQFNALLTSGLTRQASRKSKSLVGHDGKAVSPSGTNSILVMTLGQLAAWGGDIAKQQKGMAPSHQFKGADQWDITSELPASAFITHKNGAPLSAGVRAKVTVTCEKVGGVLQVVHFVASGTAAAASMDLSGNQLDTNSMIAQKREARLNRKLAADDTDFDLSSLGF